MIRRSGAIEVAVRAGRSADKGMTLPKMNFDGFSVVEFSTAVPPANPDASGFVYVVSCVKGELEEIPFYVGQTTQIWGRLNDYYWAMFDASTDFRVGEAIRYLSAKGYRVLVKYKSSADRRKEESEIIRDLRSLRRTLLNDLRGYNYQKANQSDERLRIQKFLDTLLPA